MKRFLSEIVSRAPLKVKNRLTWMREAARCASFAHNLKRPFITNAVSAGEVTVLTTPPLTHASRHHHSDLKLPQKLWPCATPASTHSKCVGNPVGLGQLRAVSSSRSRVFYLVAVHGVLGRPGGDGDGVWLAAAVALAVSVFASLPEKRHNISVTI